MAPALSLPGHKSWGHRRGTQSGFAGYWRSEHYRRTRHGTRPAAADKCGRAASRYDSGMSDNHHHHHSVLTGDTAGIRLGAALGLTVIILVIEAFVGFRANSLAL